MLLLLNALATFVAWLSALRHDVQTLICHGGIISQRGRRHYSRLRIGWEALRRGATTTTRSDLWRVFVNPPPWWLQELELPE